MRRKRTPAAGDDLRTRSRLLEASRRVFAERGFREATVRAICRAAGANVAAVNYHFGSKEALYLETLRGALSRCQTDPRLTSAPPPATRAAARQLLRGFVRGWAEAVSGSRLDPDVRLVQRELLEPTEALGTVVQEFVAPRFRALKRCLAVFLPGAGERALAFHALSIVGQVLYYRMATPVALRLLGERGLSPELGESICRHVIDFSERALRTAPRRRRP